MGTVVDLCAAGRAVRGVCKRVDRRLAGMDPEVDWAEMVSLYARYRLTEFQVAFMIYPATMRMMQPHHVSATFGHTGKLVDRPYRRFQDGNDFLIAWMVDGPESEKGRQSIVDLNRMHLGIARATPQLPGNFDQIDDFVYPLALIATTEHRLAVSLGLPGPSSAMRTAWYHWAKAVYRQLERESGPLAEESFPESFEALAEFTDRFDERAYEPTEAGHRVAVAMVGHFVERWFPRPLRPVARDLTRYLAGERLCRLHGLGWPSPPRERFARLVLKTALRVRARLPDNRTPLHERLSRTRLTENELRERDSPVRRRR
jgi:hypothetical protein